MGAEGIQGVQGGDEASQSPGKRTKSLLGSNSDDSGRTKLIKVHETNCGILTTQAQKDNLLHSGTSGSVAASTITTISVFIAGETLRVYRVLATGSVATDFTLRQNLAEIGFKQTNLEMGVEFIFPNGLELVDTDTLDVRVEHFVTGKSKTFKLFIYGE